MAVIKVDELAGEIVLAVRAYTENVSEAQCESRQRHSKSPGQRPPGDITRENGQVCQRLNAPPKEAPGSYRVYNKEEASTYPTFLEHGHAKAGGGSQLREYPTSSPPETATYRKFEKKVAADPGERWLTLTTDILAGMTSIGLPCAYHEWGRCTAAPPHADCAHRIMRT